MSVVIRIIDIVGMQLSGQPVPDGYITGADVDFMGGLGRVDVSTDVADALRFDSTMEAMQWWRQPSKVMPVREDGHPNRPLTVYSVEFEQVPR